VQIRAEDPVPHLRDRRRAARRRLGGARDPPRCDAAGDHHQLTPDGSLFDTDDFSTIAWTATDPGSGVARQGGKFDGAVTTNGATLDMLYVYPGEHAAIADRFIAYANDLVATGG
jgi:hypothetical protein